jgi:hypothetical protein
MADEEEPPGKQGWLERPDKDKKEKEGPVKDKQNNAEPDKPEEPAAEPPAASPAADPAKQVADLIQNFGVVLAPGSNFGANGSPDVVARDWLVRASGKLTPTEIEAALRHFVTPPSFEEARTALYGERVVVLEGNRGTGKFTGAIALLAQRVDRLMALPPSSLRFLSGRTYDKGIGYVLEGSPDESNTTEATVSWRMIRDRVRDAKAYLVVTSTVPAHGAVRDAVPHIGWSPPPAQEVLNEHLPGRDDVVSQLAAEASASDYTMAELADAARRVAMGEPVADVLAGSDRVLADRVNAWFEMNRGDRGQVLEITALAFLAGVRERTFETELARLEELFIEALSLPKPMGFGPDAQALPQRRWERLDDGLVARTDVSGPAATRTLAFKSPRYRRHVLAELSRKYSAQFWDPVQEWLEEIVRDGKGPLVAAGLALLARVDFGEVRDQYLEPWSRAEQGWQGQLTATYVLWMMCYDEDTLPLALPTAKQWASNGNPAQRWTAAVALSGELGILYPVEAIDRLWQLVIQDVAIRGNACIAFAGLFASLVSVKKNAALVLTMMERWRNHLVQQARDNRQGQSNRKATNNKHIRDRAISTIIEVLSVREVKGSYPAVVRLLHDQPEHATLVGGLWAYAYRHIAFRMAAQNVLLEALTALRQPNSGEPPADARETERTLAEAVASALTYDEIEKLFAELSRREARFRTKQDESFTSILLAALDRRLRRQPVKE